jgi:hypothetical protein
MATLTASPTFRPGPDAYSAQAEHGSAREKAEVVYEQWRSGSNYIDTMLRQKEAQRAAQAAANARWLRHRLRDMRTGPISAACGGVAGVIAVATGVVPFWVAMPIGLLLGWLIPDRFLAARGL